MSNKYKKPAMVNHGIIRGYLRSVFALIRHPIKFITGVATNNQNGHSKEKDNAKR